MLYGGYRINDNAIDPAIAKQKAIELTTRILPPRRNHTTYISVARV